jgi:hypothetical protein
MGIPGVSGNVSQLVRRVKWGMALYRHLQGYAGKPRREGDKHSGLFGPVRCNAGLLALWSFDQLGMKPVAMPGGDCVQCQ